MASSFPRPTVDLVETLAAGGGIVCLVGAGGKKSTIYRIAARFAGRVAITSTVHTPPFRKRLAAKTVIAAREELSYLVAGASDSRVVAYACPSDKKARLAGVSPEVAAELHRSCGFDLTLVKADGARLRWIKAPAEHEPALPAHFTSLIPLVSVRCVGEVLDQTVAHRPDRIAELLGTRVGVRITGEHVARLLSHPDGGMKGIEHADHVVPVINMVDTEEQRHTARLIAQRVLEQAPAVDRVVLARMMSDDPVVSVITR